MIAVRSGGKNVGSFTNAVNMIYTVKRYRFVVNKNVVKTFTTLVLYDREDTKESVGVDRTICCENRTKRSAILTNILGRTSMGHRS